MKGMTASVRRSTRKEVTADVVVTSSNRLESELIRLPNGVVKRKKKK